MRHGKEDLNSKKLFVRALLRLYIERYAGDSKEASLTGSFFVESPNRNLRIKVNYEIDKGGENMKKCKSCKSEIDSKATKCPHCRTDQRIWFRRHPILTFMLVLFIAPFILAGMSNPSTQNNNGGTTTPAPTKQATFNAGVNFTGTQFVISNLDQHTCENAKMKVNGDYSLDGYDLESALDSTVKTGTATVFKVGAGQFTKGDGTRLNPFATKPLNFSISCRGNNELSSAFGYWEFK